MAGAVRPVKVHALFSVIRINYSRVCGQLWAYQYATPDGFNLAELLMMSMLTEYPSHMGVLLASTSRLMLMDTILELILGYCPATMAVLHKSLPTSAVITTVRPLVTYLQVTIFTSISMTSCGMSSSVLEERLSAVPTPTCRGFSRHSMWPPLRTLKWGCAVMKALLMKTLSCKWLNSLFTNHRFDGHDSCVWCWYCQCPL